MTMTKNVLRVATLFVLLPVVTFAQSSGSFAYNTADSNYACVVNSGNGNLTGGVPCPDGTTTCIGNVATYVKTSSGAGNVFVVRPSAVVGLLTDVTVNTKNASSSAYAGVDFTVSVNGPGSPVVAPKGPVTYDARFIQISTNLFQIISSLCTTTGVANCDGYFTFNESTLSAHSFDWIVSGLQSGTYTLNVAWKPSTANAGQGSSATCVGPVNFTVQQNKVFSFNGAINTP
jgi:hypothetical protein